MEIATAPTIEKYAYENCTCLKHGLDVQEYCKYCLTVYVVDAYCNSHMYGRGPETLPPALFNEMVEYVFHDECKDGNIEIATSLLTTMLDSDESRIDAIYGAFKLCGNFPMEVCKWLWEISEGLISLSQIDDAFQRTIRIIDEQEHHNFDDEDYNPFAVARWLWNLSQQKVKCHWRPKFVVHAFIDAVAFGMKDQINWLWKAFVEHDSTIQHIILVCACQRGCLNAVECIVRQSSAKDDIVVKHDHVAFQQAKRHHNIKVLKWFVAMRPDVYEEHAPNQFRIRRFLKMTANSVHKVATKSAEFDECLICGDCTNDLLEISACGHEFCATCIGKWVVEKARNTCPYCRGDASKCSRVMYDL